MHLWNNLRAVIHLSRWLLARILLCCMRRASLREKPMTDQQVMKRMRKDMLSTRALSNDTKHTGRRTNSNIHFPNLLPNHHGELAKKTGKPSTSISLIFSTPSNIHHEDLDIKRP